MCVYLCNQYVLMYAGAYRGHKRASGPLELEFQAGVNQVMWIPELRASSRAMGTLKHQAISSAQF